MVDPMKLPHVFLAYKAIEEGSCKPPDDDRFAFGEKSCELYDVKSDADGHDLENWESRMITLDVSSSVVGLHCPALGYKSLRCSGIVFDYNGVKKIISSANVLGEPCDRFFEVEVLLPNRLKVAGHVSFVDKQYNIVFIHADLSCTAIRAATLDMKIMKLGDEVTAVGRHHTSKLMASRGRINIRGDHLTCDDLYSSSCSISEWGIGGPVIDNDSKKVIGMNFFGKKCFTPFLPSSILLRCAEHFLEPGSVARPSLGLKLRSVNELKIEDLELIYFKFHTKNGLIIKEVSKGSPADKAGICVGDVIISCNGTSLSSPVELTEILIKVVDSARGGGSRRAKRRAGPKKSATHVQVLVQKGSTGTTESQTIAIESFNPPALDEWPLLPPAEFSEGYVDGWGRSRFWE